MAARLPPLHDRRASSTTWPESTATEEQQACRACEVARHPHRRGSARAGGRDHERPRPLARSPVSCYVSLLDIELGATATPEFFPNDEDTYTGLTFLAE